MATWQETLGDVFPRGNGSSPVSGTFSWDNPETTIVSGTAYSMKFTPEETDTYKSVNSNVTVTVMPDIETGIKMVWIPAGNFEMGQTGVATPAHGVTLTNGFYMGIHQITQKQWNEIMETTIQEQEAFTSLGLYGVGDNYPMYYVNWYEAVIFCNKLSVLEELTPAYSIDGETDPEKWIDDYGEIPATWDAINRDDWDKIQIDPNSEGYRLPTEAQWEYACRAGTTTLYYWGDETEVATVGAHAWYSSNASSTQEVGTKQVNAFGLYDMHGNVWEWCWDWYGAYTDTAKEDPTGASSGSGRMLRGGSWGNSVEVLQSANRLSSDPNGRGLNFGFRVARP